MCGDRGWDESCRNYVQKKKCVFRESGECKRVHACALKTSDSVPSCVEMFSETKFRDCSTRIALPEVYCRLIIVRLDGLEKSYVERCRTDVR